MKRFRFLIVFAALALLVATAGMAQTTASLQGTVTTEGTGLPGVSVTISSPNLQGTRSTVTADGGSYYFGALPPGRYKVVFELEGMGTETNSVDVGVAQSGRADASLKVSSLTEAITVTASSPTVLETPQIAANFDSDLIDKLPVARTVLAAALLAPGVNDNTLSGSQLQISGSPGYDNLVMVNGVVITENIRSQALSLFIEDAIQETTVLTGSVSAEYGRFTGGVVNSITKSGGNEFSGSFRDSLTNPSWTNKTIWPTQADPTDKTDSIYEATFGGFVMKDRLWFFAAGRQAETSAELFTRLVPGDTTLRTDRVVQGNSNDKYEVKLTGQITPKHSLVASYFDETSATTNNRFTAVSYDLAQFSNRDDPKELKSAFYNGILSSNLLVEARYSEMFYGIGWGSGSQFTDQILGTIVRNRADGNARWNSATFCGVCDKETRTNDSWLAKANYFMSTPTMGSHNFVGGIESFSEHRYSNNFQSGSNFRVFVNSAQRVNGSETIYPTAIPGTTGSATYIIWTPIFDGANENDLQTDSVFLNDKWDINSNWSFNIGARFDKNNTVDGNGNKVSDDSRVSPRLTAIYDLKGDGRQRITASYNEYVSRVVEGPGTSAQSVGIPGYIQFAYQGPAINPVGTPTNELLNTHQALAIIFDWFNGAGGTSNLSLLRPNGFRDVPGYGYTIDKSLGSPYVQEITLGYGMQIGNNAYLKIDGISRDWSDFYAFALDQSSPQETDFLGIGHDTATVENTNLITREYRGVQLQAAWHPRRFNVGFNYTYATLQGNDEQESATSGTVGNAPGSIYYPEFLDFARNQPTGDLLGDQRHKIRTWVAYDVPIPSVLGSLNVSLLHNYDTGLPYSAIATVRVQGTGTGAPTNTNYASSPASANYYFSDRGEYRLDDINRTDASLNYSFPIRRLSLYAAAEMLNVFDNDGIVAVSTTTSSNNASANFAVFNPKTTDRSALIECPQGTAGATCRTMGAHWQKGSSFGLPTGPASYQTPRLYRFTFGVRF